MPRQEEESRPSIARLSRPSVAADIRDVTGAELATLHKDVVISKKINPTLLAYALLYREALRSLSRCPEADEIRMKLVGVGYTVHDADKASKAGKGLLRRSLGITALAPSD